MTTPPLDLNTLVDILGGVKDQLPPDAFKRVVDSLSGKEPMAEEAPEQKHHYVVAGADFSNFDEFLCAYMLHVLHGDDLTVQPYEGDKQVLMIEDVPTRITVLYQIGKVGNFDPGSAAMVISVSNRPGPAAHHLTIMDSQSDIYRQDKHKTTISRQVIRLASSEVSTYWRLPCLLQESVFYVQNGIWMTTAPTALLNTAFFDKSHEDQRQSTLRSLLSVVDGLPNFASADAERLYTLAVNAERDFQAFDDLMVNITDYL